MNIPSNHRTHRQSHMDSTPNSKLISLCRSSLASALLLLLAHSLPPAAATITFGTSSNVANYNDVFNPGELTYAYDWSSSQTINGVPFTSSPSFTSVGG